MARPYYLLQAFIYEPPSPPPPSVQDLGAALTLSLVMNFSRPGAHSWRCIRWLLHLSSHGHCCGLHSLQIMRLMHSSPQPLLSRSPASLQLQACASYSCTGLMSQYTSATHSHYKERVRRHQALNLIKLILLFLLQSVFRQIF